VADASVLCRRHAVSAASSSVIADQEIASLIFALYSLTTLYLLYRDGEGNYFPIGACPLYDRLGLRVGANAICTVSPENTMTNSCSKQLVVVRLPDRARRIPILTVPDTFVVCFAAIRERCVAEE